MIKDKCTFLIHGSIGLIVLIGLICGFLAFDASQHTARAATHSIQTSHHAHNSDGKSPSRRSTSRYHYSTTHYYHSSGTGAPLDTATATVIIIVCIIIAAFWAVFKWLRQNDYNDE